MRQQVRTGDIAPRSGREREVRRSRWSRMLWTVLFGLFIVPMLVIGVLHHRVWLVTGAMWAGALACVLRAEALDAPARSVEQPSPRMLLARAGWVLLALLLIFAGGGPLRLVHGTAG